MVLSRFIFGYNFTNTFQLNNFCMPLSCSITYMISRSLKNSDGTTHCGSLSDRLTENELEMIFGKVSTGDRVRLRLVCKLWNRIIIQSNIPTVPVDLEKLEDTIHCGSPWDRFPDDILEIIFGKLWTGDRVRLKLVCKLWNRILIQSHIPTAPEAPWEILSNDSYNNPEPYLTQICLKSLSEDRIYRFKLPMLDGQLENRGWLCAHSRGWLILAAGPNLNPDVFLWNPLTGVTRKLPPLCTLPFFEDFEVTENTRVKIQSFSSVIHRVEIFSVGSVDCVVAALFRTSRGNRIAFCTPQELKWTLFTIEQEDEEDIKFADILFHTVEGKLNALAIDTSSTNPGAKNFKSKNFEVTLTDCQVQVVPLIVPRDETDSLVQYGFQISTRQRTCWRLVESSITHSVICVAAKLELFASIRSGLIPACKCYQTTQLIASNVDCKMEAIFVGATGSFSLPASHGIVPGCVYFATDNANGLLSEGNNTTYYTVRESGHYFLTQNRMRRNPSRTIKYPPTSKIGWFMPQLFMC